MYNIYSIRYIVQKWVSKATIVLLITKFYSLNNFFFFIFFCHNIFLPYQVRPVALQQTNFVTSKFHKFHIYVLHIYVL